jgi:hypothetical protein
MHILSNSSNKISFTLIRNRSLCLSIIILISPICRTGGITTEKVFNTVHEISIPLWWLSLIVLCLVITLITLNLRFSLFHFLYLLHVLCLFCCFKFLGTHTKLLLLIRLIHITTLCLSLALTLSLSLYLLLNSHLLFHLPCPFYFFLLHLLCHLLVS